MRMWMIPTYILCRQHLLGEHNELHKWLPILRRKVGVHGRFHPIVTIQFKDYIKRHDELASEMLDRDYKHNTPMLPQDLPDFKTMYPEYCELEVNPTVSYLVLIDRCEHCRRRIQWLKLKWHG